jgi:hypothetical protein
MKRLQFILFPFLLYVSCIDEQQEREDLTAPMAEEQTHNLFLSIDDAVYDELSRDMAFQSLCTRYEFLSSEIDKMDSTMIAEMIDWYVSLAEFETKYKREDLIAYIIKHEHDRPLTRIELPEVTVTGHYELYVVWRDAWWCYDLMTSPLLILANVPESAFYADFSDYLYSCLDGDIKSFIYGSIARSNVSNPRWQLYSTNSAIINLFWNILNFRDQANYYYIVRSMGYDFATYFTTRRWQRLIELPGVKLNDKIFTSFRIMGYGGIGSISASTPPASPVVSNAEKIFKSSSLSKEMWEKVEEMIKHIMNDCMGGRVYNALEGKKIELRIDKGNSYLNGQITITENSSSDALFHEMFHAYQHTQDKDPANYINREVEAQIAEFKYVRRLPEEEKKKSLYARNPTHRQVRSLALLSDFFNENGQVRVVQGRNISAEQVTSAFVDHGNLLRNFKGRYQGKPFNTSKNITDNTSNLLELSKDC